MTSGIATTSGVVGGVDENGCCIGCGEQYCESTSSCFFPWLETCDDSTSSIEPSSTSSITSTTTSTTADPDIANAGNTDFARRSIRQTELVGTGNIALNTADSFSGVRLSGINRADSALLQRQARDSASALASTSAELRALGTAETALERTGLYDSLVGFEAAFTRLESDPTSAPLRTAALESARQLAGVFNTANESLANARRLTIGEAEADVLTINTLTDDLARINREMVAARENSAAKAALLDSRDAALAKLAEQVGISASFNPNGTVLVTANGTPPTT